MPKVHLNPPGLGGFFFGEGNDVMHPVLKNALDNPRMPGPYGSDKGDNGFESIGVRGIDTYIKTNMRGWWFTENRLQHANDN